MNRGLFAKCLIIITLFSICLHPDAAFATKHKSKKTKKHHQSIVSVAPLNQPNPKYASIVIDAETGTILSQDNPDALRHPASLTKMMTLLLVFDALQSGKMQSNQTIYVSQRAASMPASKLGLRAGSRIRVSDAVASLATLSANDMAVALAEAIGGSESNFARKMTARAASINMSRTRFYNASGLPNGYQITTARDMARLARYTLATYPDYSRIYSRGSFYYNGRTYSNHNHLMETYSGMDCCKTGYINASGFNLVASAKRNGRRMIGVVFGGRTSASRNIQMASLLDEGFEKAQNLQLVAAAVKKPAAPATKENRIISIKKYETPAPVAAPAVEPAEEKSDDDAPEITTTAEITKLNPSYPKAEEKIALAAPPQNLGTLPATKNLVPPAPVQPLQAAYTSTTNNNAGWAIQIGAYQTRLATDQAIERAENKLPARLRKSQSVVVPLRTADASWMFRARLSGFTQSEAVEACQYFKDCLTISPQAY